MGIRPSSCCSVGDKICTSEASEGSFNDITSAMSLNPNMTGLRVNNSKKLEGLASDEAIALRQVVIISYKEVAWVGLDHGVIPCIDGRSPIRDVISGAHMIPSGGSLCGGRVETSSSGANLRGRLEHMPGSKFIVEMSLMCDGTRRCWLLSAGWWRYGKGV